MTDVFSAKSFVQSLTHNFTERVERKNSWGKNEVLNEFTMACIDTLLSQLDKQAFIKDLEKGG